MSRLDALGAVIEKTKPLMKNFIPEALDPSIKGGTWWKADITLFPPKMVYSYGWSMVNGLLFHMTQPTSRSVMKAIACSKPIVSEIGRAHV